MSTTSVRTLGEEPSLENTKSTNIIIRMVNNVQGTGKTTKRIKAIKEHLK